MFSDDAHYHVRSCGRQCLTIPARLPPSDSGLRRDEQRLAVHMERRY
jgi:hypothetical protein